MKRKIDLTRLTTILCAIPTLGLLICQFLPFWKLGDQHISINRFIWFCFEHADYEKYFGEFLGNPKFSAGNIVGCNVITLIACVLGVFFCIKKPDELWTAAFPVIGAAAGLYSYIAYPIYRIGSLWGLHIAMCIIMLALVERIILLRLMKRNEALA